MSHPFHGDDAAALYAAEDRTRQRSDALLSAKTGGRNVNDVILGHIDRSSLPPQPKILDLGCGQGRTAVRLAGHIPDGTLLAVDASPAMVKAARERMANLAVAVHVADFHDLPVQDASIDLVTAVMCLYHSPTPVTVAREIHRTLRSTGTAIIVTKAADSYSELADLLERTGLDPTATTRPSLYESAHSGNLQKIIEKGGLQVRTVEHETHTFAFNDHAHTAGYLATCPQYALPPQIRTADSLTAALRERLPDGPTTTTTTITYLVAERPRSAAR